MSQSPSQVLHGFDGVQPDFPRFCKFLAFPSSAGKLEAIDGLFLVIAVNINVVLATSVGLNVNIEIYLLVPCK